MQLVQSVSENGAPPVTLRSRVSPFVAGRVVISTIILGGATLVQLSTLTAGFRLMMHGLDCEGLHGWLREMKRRQAAGLLTLLEPLMIAVLGGVVGGIVIAMYMPIFSLISKLTGS